MKVFVLDNYDSFTFNLVQYLGELGADVEVARNDATPDRADRRALVAGRVVISPGPGWSRATPASRSHSSEWCARNATPLLGVCLGHQAIAEAFGGRSSRRRA